MSFTRAIAAELAAVGSTLIINEWIPGTFRTQMSGNTGDDPSVAFDRLATVWKLSGRGPGGRTFAGDVEHLPPRSLKSRVKSRLKICSPAAIDCELEAKLKGAVKSYCCPSVSPGKRVGCPANSFLG